MNHPGMDGMTAELSSADAPWTIAGNLDAQVRETHTGVVVLLGDKAYKAKKPIATDFLDFTTVAQREAACAHEVTLNSRLAPDSYLGVAHFAGPGGGPAEPVVVMRRYADSTRLASLVKNGRPVHDHLEAIAHRVARFHAETLRSATIDSYGTAEAVSARWQQNLVELQRYAGTVIPEESLQEVARLSAQFIAGRGELFAERISSRRIVDGHADLLADDIFCTPGDTAILDCLEFDDKLRYVDSIDDAAFLAMDLEFLSRHDLGEFFLEEYSRCARDPVPDALKHFYIAYRAVVRAKVDCVRFAQGHAEASTDARRHIDIALEHLRTGTVQLIIIAGGPGTGKTTLSRGLAEQSKAEVISTDEVRRELEQTGAIAGAIGVLDSGLYTPENVTLVYDEVLRRAHILLGRGLSVILDGTWRDPVHRARARRLAGQTQSPIVELTCTVPLDEASERIGKRPVTTSDATPEIAAAMSEPTGASTDGHPIDTTRPLADSIAEARQICCLAI
ncbi:MAG: bifunctional aminoglycoside phosphotransferase/ATP-binding protein [Mycobacterium sp.]